MSEETAVAGRVMALLTQHLGMPPEIVTPTAQLGEDLGVDSVDGVEFALALEREFNMSLPDAIFGEVRTVQDVIDLVGERIGASSGVARD